MTPAFRLIAVLAFTALSAIGEEIPKLIAHRGASEDAPENTLAAIRLAWRQGADGIEADFLLSADGEVVCIHDPKKENGRAGFAPLIEVLAITMA